jgi:endonuclease-8
MPEGDTIHKVAAAIRERLEGEALARAWARELELSSLAGRRVELVDALGKHLLVSVEGGRSLRTHLGMHGSWHRYPVGKPWKRPRRQASLLLATAADEFVCFNARDVELLHTAGIRNSNFVARLGPDLISDAPAPGELVRRTREVGEAGMPLADVLLDQRLACGVGNVYKSEVLFLERCNPWARLGDISDGQLEALWNLAAQLLRANLGGGRRVTRPQQDGLGRLWVYGRSGQRCLRCGRARIAARRMGAHHRSTYWCPACQAGVPVAPDRHAHRLRRSSCA